MAYTVNENKEIIRQKAAQVDAIAKELTDCSSAVLVDYRGVTVDEFTALRAKCRAAGTTVHVLKNTLILRAAEKCGIDCSEQGIEPSLHGPTAVFYSFDDPAAAPRILREFMTKTKKMSVKAGVVGNTVLDEKGVQALADLPSREVLVARLMGTINRPAAGFVGVLAAVPGAFVRVLEAVRKQKEEAA